MVKIHGLIMTYNGAESIIDCLRSLDGKVDEIIILDGRWIGVNGYSLHSTDGTIEKIIEWGIDAKSKVKLMLAKEQVHQVDARYQLINAVPEGDFFLFIDSDEVIGKWNPKIDENQIGYRIRLTTEKIFKEKPDFKGILSTTPRLMKKINGIHYTKNHRYVENNDGAIFIGDLPYINEILLVAVCPEKAMRKTMLDYETWLFKWETENFK